MISVILHDDCKGGRGDRGLCHTRDSLDALAQSRDSARQGKMVMRVESLFTDLTPHGASYDIPHFL